MKQKVALKAKFKESAANTNVQTYEGKVSELNTTGCFLQTDGYELQEGSIIDLMIYDKQKHFLTVESEVKWIGSKRMSGRHVYGMGVEFFYKSWKDYKKIKQLVPREKIQKNYPMLVVWIILLCSLLWLFLRR